ncbi:hypothetical protein Talka_00942 [Tepidimonas alkaliphilus]|uniref:Uncharacterized protein n=1 Tax=Tepidimonas alkaliphilus TaxID=2588942 RepID=A0A554WAI7_9BURK|nr:hypothetical protein Talka_00942 [Tepidimonas alkaliphilus]
MRGGTRTHTQPAYADPLPVRAQRITAYGQYSLPGPRLKPRGFARGGHLPAHQRQQRRQLVAAALQLRLPQRGKDGFQRLPKKGDKG